jgi:uncharacterized coiled-coil protein SlyX
MQYNLVLLSDKVNEANKAVRKQRRVVQRQQDKLISLLERAGIDTRLYLDAFEVSVWGSC